MEKIEAMPTAYKGQIMRSRLEGRWATFFDALRIEWEYEAKPFFFRGIGYLPDFRFKKSDCFVEIKPRVNSDMSKPKLLAMSGEKVVVLCGPPTSYAVLTNCRTCGLLCANKKTDLSRELERAFNEFSVCEDCGAVEICSNQIGRRFRCGGCNGVMANKHFRENKSRAALTIQAAIQETEELYETTTIQDLMLLYYSNWRGRR